MTLAKLNPLNRLVSLSLLGVIFALVLAAPAMAQDPTDAQYDDSVAQTNQAGGGGGDTKVTPGIPDAPKDGGAALEQDIVSGLPITGLDVIALAAVALSLTAMGFALRYLSAPGQDAG